MASDAPGAQGPEHYWLDPGRLMAGEWAEPHLDWLAGQGVAVLVNLTERSYRDERFRIHDIPVVDGTAPDESQIRRFCAEVDRELAEDKAVYVHCLAGCGRTGTMMACYLVYRERLDPLEAIRRLRGIRTCSVETAAQADAVIDWSLRMQASGYRL